MPLRDAALSNSPQRTTRMRRANKSMPPDQDDYDYNRVAPGKMTQDEMLEQVKRRNRLDRHQANRSA